MAIGPFMDSPGGYGRKPRKLLPIMMLALLVVVLFVVFKVIPQPNEILSDRTAGKRLAEARRLEEQSLNLYAAEKYALIMDSPRVKNELRLQAARGLARTSRAAGRLEAAEAALEKAFAFSPPGPDQAAVREELENLRGRPMGSFAGAEMTSTGAAMENNLPAMAVQGGNAPGPLSGNPYPLPPGARVLARIGSEPVSMEEITYAWQRFNGYRKPNEDEFNSFVRLYIDLVLMADEAARNGIDRQEDTIYNLRIQRVMGLSQALTEKLVRDLKTPERATLTEYYQGHKELFMTPDRAVIGHIMVQDDGDAALVKRALSQGQSFSKTAQKYGRDTDKLKDGYILGEISSNDPGIPGFGPNPQLIRRLLAMSDGATTGPLKTPQGLEFIHIVQKTRGKLRPFEEVEESVLLSYQKQQLAVARQSLIQRLHQERPIEIEDPKLRQVVMQALEATSATTATAASAAPLPPPATPQTTATLAGAPEPPAAEAVSSSAENQNSSSGKTVRAGSGKKSGKDR